MTFEPFAWFARVLDATYQVRAIDGGFAAVVTLGDASEPCLEEDLGRFATKPAAIAACKHHHARRAA